MKLEILSENIISPFKGNAEGKGFRRSLLWKYFSLKVDAYVMAIGSKEQGGKGQLKIEN